MHRMPVQLSSHGKGKGAGGWGGGGGVHFIHPHHDSPGSKLQALVYDILPSRKVPENDARSVPWQLPSGLPSLLIYVCGSPTIGLTHQRGVGIAQWLESQTRD